MTELTSPLNCAECGSAFTDEIILAGGSAPAVIIIRGHNIPIPGLWSCQGCTQAIAMGARESGITLEAARDFLNDFFGPMMVQCMMTANNGEEVAKAVERLQDCMEVQDILEACILLQGEPGGLGFIPECKGDCGGEHTDPRKMAHLN